jgi:hypothetical protein
MTRAASGLRGKPGMSTISRVTRARGDGHFRRMMRWVPRTYPQVVLLSIAYGTTSIATAAFDDTVSVRTKALLAVAVIVLSLANGALGLRRADADAKAAERWSREHPADLLDRVAAAVRVRGDQETVTRTEG